MPRPPPLVWRILRDTKEGPSLAGIVRWNGENVGYQLSLPADESSLAELIGPAVATAAPDEAGDAIDRLLVDELPSLLGGALRAERDPLPDFPLPHRPHRYQRNHIPTDFAPANILAATLRGDLVWAKTTEGDAFKAGGALPDGVETWLTVSRLHDGQFMLVVTQGLRLVLAPMRQREQWFGRRSDLAQLHDTLVNETN